MSLICATRDIRNGDLLDALEAAAGGDEVLQLSAVDTEGRLMNNECDVALVSPLVYTKNQSEFRLVPGCGLSSVGAVGDLLLVFNRGLYSLQSLVVLNVDEMDSMLCSIVLREKFDMSPVVRGFNGTVDAALQHHDGVLVSGSAARAIDTASYATMDIVDEWYDMTRLPYVRSVFVGWQHRVTPAMVGTLRRVCAGQDAASLKALESKMAGVFSADTQHFIPAHSRYILDDDVTDGLMEFFRLAFYHGFHRDIPIFSIWSEDDGE